MNSKIYRQYDTRWGNLLYPSKPYTLSRSGCGCVAVTHCIIEQEKYKNYTPKDVRKYMVQFATKGYGTLWDGITKGLEHYGYNVHWKQSDSMSDIWKILNGKSLKVGIILFGSTKGPDGTEWTSDGHFISFTGYKVENNKHYFYLKDSGGRKHDGWWCYEKSMKGDVRQVWICTSLKENPDPTSPNKPSKIIDVSYWQHNIDWKKASKEVKGVFIRASYTSQKSFVLSDDSKFADNVKGAFDNGVKIGAYHYSQAISTSEAKSEAEHLCRKLNPYRSKINLPVVCDWEFGGRLNSSKAKSLGKAKCTEIVSAFCEVVKSYGYIPMIYANYNTFSNYLDYKKLKSKYLIWLAQYSSKASLECDYWQYTSSGSVSGIKGKVDMNKAFSKTTKTYTGDFPDWVLLSGNIIAKTGKDLAYPKGTPKKDYTYGKSHPTQAFQKAINKVYPDRKSWSKQCQEGASCDVGSATVIRYSGADTKIPRGLEKQFPYMAKNGRFKEMDIKEGKNFKAGDIGLWLNKTSGGHIWICVGDGIIVEANHTAGYFLHVDTDNWKAKGRKEYHCYRMKVAIRKYITKGDAGSEIRKLQKFLKWYGYDLAVDGSCGLKTEQAVKDFQSAENLVVDGRWGEKCNAKAKEVKR